MAVCGLAEVQPEDDDDDEDDVDDQCNYTPLHDVMACKYTQLHACNCM